MAEWKSAAHLDDHYGRHRGKVRTRSLEEYDASAQETIAVGVRFTYRDILTSEPRIGYFHRDSSRLTAMTVDSLIVTHHLTDEERVASLPRSTYRDD